MAMTTISRPPELDAPTGAQARRAAVQDTFARWLAAHSISALRVSLGVVILGFGSLKYVAGASPAEELVKQTTDALTFGLVSGTPALIATAVLETFIGLTLVTGRFLKPGLLVMAGWLVGILMPVVLFPGEMFPGGLPTLAAQYVLKDVILVAAACVVAAKALGGFGPEHRS